MTTDIGRARCTLNKAMRVNCRSNRAGAALSRTKIGNDVLTKQQAAEPATAETGMARLQHRLHELYYGDSGISVRFRLSWIVTDIVIIGFFMVAPVIRESKFFLTVDYVIAALVALDLAARAFAWAGGGFLKRPSTWIDIFVLCTLLLPQWLFNLGFLRILRLWTLFNGDLLWRTLGRRYDHTRVQDVTRSLVTLITFVFIATGFVYTSFATIHPEINGYIDALYFTVSTLTTTGFGDITLPGMWGRILSTMIMIGGITFFVRVAQAIFRPNKVHFSCPTCSLSVHDPDAVYCKACGTLVNIPNDEG